MKMTKILEKKYVLKVMFDGLMLKYVMCMKCVSRIEKNNDLNFWTYMRVFRVF